ncbi:MAG: hypothetical protein QW217_02895 [Candidatus Caldarchaeum sp.]
MMRTLLHWGSLMRSQWYSREKLEQLQSEKFRRLVWRAYNEVPFHRRLYSPEMVEKVRAEGGQASEWLPVLSRTQLAQVSLEERTSSAVDPASCIKRMTSGSSGIPLVVLESKSSGAYWTALQIRALWAFGVRPGDKVAWLTPIPSNRSIAFYKSGLFNLVRPQAHLLDVKDIHTRSFPQLVELQPDVMIASPTTLELLMDYCERKEVKLSPKVIGLSSETSTPSFRRRVQNFFSAEVFDRYSAVEVGPIAWECPERVGYHVNMEGVLLELVNVRRATRSTEEGEVVVSCLYRDCTPVIRYLLGDIVRTKDDECPCGRGLPLIESIQGRKVDIIKRKNGEDVSPYAVITALDHIQGVRKFRVVQKPDYTVEVYVVLSSSFGENELVESIERCLGDVLRGLQVRVKPVEVIGDGSGIKQKLVESHVV